MVAGNDTDMEAVPEEPKLEETRDGVAPLAVIVTVLVTLDDMAWPGFAVVASVANRVEQALSMAGISLFSAIELTLVDKAAHSDESCGFDDAVKAAAMGAGVSPCHIEHKKDDASSVEVDHIEISGPSALLTSGKLFRNPMATPLLRKCS